MEKSNSFAPKQSEASNGGGKTGTAKVELNRKNTAGEKGMNVETKAQDKPIAGELQSSFVEKTVQPANALENVSGKTGLAVPTKAQDAPLGPSELKSGFAEGSIPFDRQ